MDDGSLGYPSDYSKSGWLSALEWFASLIGLCLALVLLGVLASAVLVGIDALFGLLG
jgi:hypothetical protein